MKAEDIQFINASSLSEPTEDLSNKKNIELDFFVQVNQKGPFLKECLGKNLFLRKLPPNKKFHLILERWDNKRHIVVDAQIGPFFNKGALIHKTPNKSLLRDLFVFDDDGNKRVSATGRAMLYAANCVWLKQSRLSKRNIEKLQRLSLLALDSPNANNMSCFQTIHSISKLDEKLSVSESRDEIEYLIEPHFVSHLNPVRQIMPRRNFSLGNDKTDIIFIGPDGVGKTTLIKAVIEALPIKTGSGYLGIGKEGWKLWFAKALSERRKNRFASVLFWYMVLPVELMLRRAIMLHRGRGRVIIIDRVPGMPLLRKGALLWLYRIILPRPCIVVLLTGDPVKIASRKPEETTPERTEKELVKWKCVAKRLKSRRIIEIDTTHHNLETCRDIVVEAIRTDPGVSANLYKRQKKGALHEHGLLVR